MKVLFQSRLDLFDKRGGDTVQILETKKALEKLGVLVDIDNSIKKDVSRYDIVHVFNLDWVCEPYLQVKNAKEQGKKVVLSPIHHSLKEFERYENECRYGLVKIGNFLLRKQEARDVARNLVKGLIYPRKLKCALIQLYMGIRRQQRCAVKLSDYILVQTVQEEKDLEEDYSVKGFKWKKIVNGINPRTFENPNPRKVREKYNIKDYVLCAARIEPRKNQLNLIKAFRKAKNLNKSLKDTHLLFIGAMNKHHPSYIWLFKRELRKYDDIRYLGYISQDEIKDFYAGARIFACPSYFETTGLAYLEAAVSGVKSLVACGERSKEYLGTNAVYCDPGDINSIGRALISALKPTVDASFPLYIKRNFTWEKCASETLRVYEELLTI